MSSKEGRGGLSRFGIGRGGSDADKNGGDDGASESKSESKKSKVEAKAATVTADKRKTEPEIVAAPAVTDGEVLTPAEPVSVPASANGSASAPVNASASANGGSSGSSAPAKTASAVVDAPPAKPVKKVPLAPSRAGSAREKAEPLKSDAPIPRSRLGRTKSSDALRAPRVRRARLKIANIDPWSVMKVSFLFSVALGVILLVAVALLWLLLDFMGFFSTVASTVDDISGEEGSSGFDVVAFFSLPRVLGMATIVALVDIVMITALTTLAAYLYNISTDLVGGVEVTLAEEE
ncbi:DUF3566 domain-containing protein [Sporichthya polymorpha]|uniref:DUF3566 domain-containing protein n=1 Tax=Sporichthya polymorpha TaxID=35751 RepID=UPI000361F0EF|nr:DUF3566 domain-containing protein [Sporichthya polymorpha]